MLRRNHAAAITRRQTRTLPVALFAAWLIYAAFVGIGAVAAEKGAAAENLVVGNGTACSTNGAAADDGSGQPQPRGASLQEEMQCAAKWLKDDVEFEYEIGMVPIGDQIVWNSRKLDMVALYKRPAQSDFDFHHCAIYGYERPTNLTQFSVNRWSAINSLCKPFDVAVSVDGGQAMPNLTLRDDDRAECERFRRNYATPSALETELRSTHHPIP